MSRTASVAVRIVVIAAVVGGGAGYTAYKNHANGTPKAQTEAYLALQNEVSQELNTNERTMMQKVSAGTATGPELRAQAAKDQQLAAKLSASNPPAGLVLANGHMVRALGVHVQEWTLAAKLFDAKRAPTPAQAALLTRLDKQFVAEGNAAMAEAKAHDIGTKTAG